MLNFMLSNTPLKMNFLNIYSIRYSLSLIILSLCVTTSNGYAETISLPDPLVAGWKGKPVCEQLYEDAEKRILRCTFAPGTGHERHYHVPHFGYALAGGRVQITDENGVREVTLTTGSSYTSEGVLWHEIINIGKSTIRYLIVENKSNIKDNV